MALRFFHVLGDTDAKNIETTDFSLGFTFKTFIYIDKMN